MDYFLMSRDRRSIEVERFIDLLRARWPASRLKTLPDPEDHHSVEFELPMEESTLLGSLNREGSTVIFYGAIRDCAGFALWYQSVVPELCPLLMFDEGYGRSIGLQPDTTAGDIIHALSDEPSSD
jgi:hypothetical protein